MRQAGLQADGECHVMCRGTVRAPSIIVPQMALHRQSQRSIVLHICRACMGILHVKKRWSIKIRLPDKVSTTPVRIRLWLILQMLFGACPSCAFEGGDASYGGSSDFSVLTAAARAFKAKGGMGAFIWSAEHQVSGNRHLDADFTTILSGGALSN